MSLPFRFRRRSNAKATGGTYDEVSFGPIPSCRVYRVTRFATKDIDNAPTGKLEVYVDGHGYEHLVVEEATPSANELWWENQAIELNEGESLVARYYGATVNDRLRLFVEGQWGKTRKQRAY